MIVRVGFANLAFGVDDVDGEIARPAGWPRAMKVEVRIHRVGVEIIDGGRIFLRDMAVAHRLADYRAVFAFSQRIVVGLAWS